MAKNLSEYLTEMLNIETVKQVDMIEEGDSIKDEKSFRAAAESKFKKVFGDKLDETKMNDIIDGILKNYKKEAENGEWGKLIGILNKSF